MELLLIIVLIPAGYVGLIRLTARWLPATEGARRALKWAYWGSLAFVLWCWLAYTLGGWLFRFPAVFFAGFISSGCLAGVLARLRLGSAGLHGWLTFHSWANLPLALLLALGWVLALRYDPVYQNQHASVELAKDFSLSDNDSWTITFYRRTALFEAPVGRVRSYGGDAAAGLLTPEGWRDVRAVTFDAQHQTAIIHRYSGELLLPYVPQ